jgi:hypothetical protein
MAFILSDERIKALVEERKSLPIGWCEKFTKAPKHGQTEYHLSDIEGAIGNKFEIILRESNSNPSSFAVIFGVYLPKFIRLIRYNSNNHTHTNKIEGNRVCGFHIHYTTERYQRRKLEDVNTKIDDYAKETTHYQDLKGALQCLIKEANFQETSTLFRRHEK